MNSGCVATTHASQWSVCGLSGAKFPHTHMRAHPHGVKYYYTIQSPPERARMCASIFSNGCALGVVCVSDAMCQGSIMLRIQSDGPEHFAQSSAECLCPAPEGGHVLTSLCARVSALRSIGTPLPPPHNEKATYLSPYG